MGIPLRRPGRLRILQCGACQRQASVFAFFSSAADFILDVANPLYHFLLPLHIWINSYSPAAGIRAGGKTTAVEWLGKELGDPAGGRFVCYVFIWHADSPYRYPYHTVRENRRQFTPYHLQPSH